MDGTSTELSVDQKFAKVLVKLRKSRPFYSAVYETIPHIKTDSIDTMGVTTTKLVYNEQFVSKRSFDEFYFIVLHEIWHIALMHPARISKMNKELYNVVCDLYINKALAEEFGLTPGKKDFYNEIQMPTDCLYCSSLDLDINVTETMYAELEEKARQLGYFEGKDVIVTWKGPNRTPDQWHTVEINLTHEKHNGVSMMNSDDIIDDGEESSQQEDNCKSIISEAIIRNEMLNNDGDGSGAGSGAGRLTQLVQEILKSKVDWLKLLRKYCIAYTTTDTSFKVPDKRMYYQDAIYPGRMSEESYEIKGLKLCIDTSGSVDDTDLGYILGQINDIAKQFRVESELICWDTIAMPMGEMDSKELQSARGICGRGGTDPTCIFKYFDSKKCKVKPFVTLIFTDGFFFSDIKNSKWAKKYKNTIWVMTRNYNKEFKPPFGKVAYAKFSSAYKK